VFTGIVEGVGEVRAVVERPGGRTLEIAAVPDLFASVVVGDSVSVAGVCLTVVRRGVDRIEVELVPETLRRTRLGAVEPGDRLNLERALRLGDRLGGHLVLGHVDGVGRVVERVAEGDGARLVVDAEAALARYLPTKAFVALDGVSLTVADGADGRGRFAVALIPETLRRTTLGQARAGLALNLEIDPVARYLEALLAARADQAPAPATTDAASEGVDPSR
jgi:riboflavin synthase